MSDQAVSELVDHLFRHKAGQMVATLTRLFGLDNLQLAEDVVQDTLLQALRQWSYRGVPENPGGWLLQVAKNRAIDILRRQTNLRHKLSYLDDHASDDRLRLDDPLGDDQLTMLFIGCHPAFSPEVRITLLLKTLGGFSVSEIARAFLLPEATVAQRLVRARRKIRDLRLTFELPPELVGRLDDVLTILYLLFNEGYGATLGDQLVRADMCEEAIRLGELLAANPIGDQPHVHALLALMWLHVSRLPARTDAAGGLLLLSEQDRAKWNRGAIQRGFDHLRQARTGSHLTEYHLQAGIAACHAAAPNYEATDWETVLFYYDQLIALRPSPVFRLNRAVAVAMQEGADAGLRALDTIRGLERYYLLPAVYGELYERKADTTAAAQAYERALALATNGAERQFLLKKLARVTSAMNAAPCPVPSVDTLTGTPEQTPSLPC